MHGKVRLAAHHSNDANFEVEIQLLGRIAAPAIVRLNRSCGYFTSNKNRRLERSSGRKYNLPPA